jgi:hypothetical protein
MEIISKLVVSSEKAEVGNLGEKAGDMATATFLVAAGCYQTNRILQVP